MSSRMIDYRIDRHRLHPEHPGVYAFGHPASTREARWMAAVLAGGRTLFDIAGDLPMAGAPHGRRAGSKPR
jgi:hypothetical protein